MSQAGLFPEEEGMQEVQMDQVTPWWINANIANKIAKEIPKSKHKHVTIIINTWFS